MFQKILGTYSVMSCNLTKVSHKAGVLFFNDTYKSQCLFSLHFKFLPVSFDFKGPHKKRTISNNGALKYSASDFTQLHSGIVRDFECCWVTVQSAFLSIKCLSLSDRAHKRGNRDGWDCFNLITLRDRINTNIFFCWDNEVQRVMLSQILAVVSTFSFHLCNSKSKISLLWPGALNQFKHLTWKKTTTYASGLNHRSG